MELRLEKCTIRDWRAGDAASLARHGNNRKVSAFLRDQFPHPYTINDAEAYLARVLGEESRTAFCIDVGGVPVGGIGIEFYNDVYRQSATIGYWLGEELWNRGIMTEVVRAFTEWAFASFPLNRVSAEVFSNNPASARVLEKAGYTFEGRLRSRIVKYGIVLDGLMYARIRQL
ncbi:MAG: GNAT family N-acetyltransferase [Chthoniobacterales bacterium]